MNLVILTRYTLLRKILIAIEKVPEYGIAPLNGTVSNKHFYWDTDFRYSIGDLLPIFLLAFPYQFRKPFAPTF